jgi:hypothetical protein
MVTQCVFSEVGPEVLNTSIIYAGVLNVSCFLSQFCCNGLARIRNLLLFYKCEQI